MKRHLLLLIGVLTSLTVIHLKNGLPAHAQDDDPGGKGGARVSRKTKLLNQLKTLLEPLGVSVTEAALIDVGKVKDTSELVIRWEAYPQAGRELVDPEKVKDRPVGKEMKVIKKAKRHDGLAERFAFSLTPEQLFIAGLGADSQLRWWTVTRDPRIVNAESFEPGGKITGGIQYDPNPHLFISLPDTPTITELLILQPRQVGEGFTLEILTRLPLLPVE